MRRAILVFLLFPSVGGPTGPTEQFDWLVYHSIQLERPWNIFLRKLLGCPLDMRVIADKTNCDPRRGQIDYRQFARCRDAAAQLFQLKEK